MTPTDNERRLWDGTPHLYELFRLAGAPLDDRRRRLFAVACCKRMTNLLTDDRSREAVRVAELYALDELGERERQSAEDDAFLAYIDMRDRRLVPDDDRPRWNARDQIAARAAALCVSKGMFHAEESAAAARKAFAMGVDAWMRERQEEAFQCALLRDILGPLPFRPVRVDPVWLVLDDHAAARLAADIVAEQAFDRLFLLADALEEAGCTDAEMLAHCRLPEQMHARGCWVLDALTASS